MAIVTARDARLTSAANITAYTTAISNITTAAGSGLTSCAVAVVLDDVTKNKLTEDGFVVTKTGASSFNVDWSDAFVLKAL